MLQCQITPRALTQFIDSFLRPNIITPYHASYFRRASCPNIVTHHPPWSEGAQTEPYRHKVHADTPVTDLPQSRLVDWL